MIITLLSYTVSGFVYVYLPFTFAKLLYNTSCTLYNNTKYMYNTSKSMYHKTIQICQLNASQVQNDERTKKSNEEQN